MLVAFSLLGLGAIVALAMSLFDGGDAESDTSEAEQTTFGSEDDTVASTGYSGAINTLFDSLVAEGEVTEAEAEAALAQVDFVTGTLNVATQAGDDGVLGSSGDDIIDAGEGDDSVIGGAGDDRVWLGDGSDLYGYDERSAVGNDDIIPFPQDAAVFGADSIAEAGNDTVYGGAGHDFIADGFGSNFIQGQQGDDFIVTVDQDALSPDTVQGGFGNDVIFVDEGDVVTLSQGLDRVTVDVFGGVTQDYQVVTITDFDPTRDTLELEGAASLLRTPTPTAPGAVVVNPVAIADLEDGSGAVVTINEIPVVLVVGGQGLTLANIRLST